MTTDNVNPRCVYTGASTREIVFPLGGIGTGSIGLGGNGRLTDWEIDGRPHKGAINDYSHLAVKAAAGGRLLCAKVLAGDLYKDLAGAYGKGNFAGYGYGPQRESLAGFPHFREHTFIGEFPIARLEFADPAFPGRVSLTAFNPFIPLDDKNSSLPAAFFEVTMENTAAFPIDYTAAFSVRNPFSRQTRNRFVRRDGWSGLAFWQEACGEDAPEYGELTLATDARDVQAQEAWYRGEWFDGPTVYWRDFAQDGPLPPRRYDEPGGGDVATLAVPFSLEPGETRTVRFLLAWRYPNRVNYWNPCREQTPQGERDVVWKTYDSTLFPTSQDTAAYALANWTSLYERTRRFQRALFASTLPPEVSEAVSANLAVLKTPTVMRLEDGSFYGWEGLHETAGSCEGSCTHVWNYAYALPFLFPKLERSMRELDVRYNLWEDGRMSFRLQLPLGRGRDGFHPCVDGQMGGVIKTYREWKLCGDDDWLRSLWPQVKLALEYAWSPANPYRWDGNKDGVLEGRQHHTLDMELYGPNAWLQGFYLAALRAGEEMAAYLGEAETAAAYRALFEKGKAWTKEHLFNGAYFDQPIGLTDRQLLDPYDEETRSRYWNEEAGELKYQIGHGCEIDQLCGQWHADLCGLGDLFDREQTRTALQSLFRNNFKPDMRAYCNPCRVYCLNGESGMVICEYPDGAHRPAVPVPYCQECMTGMEYQAAALLIREGLREEGLAVVRAVRDRYDGDKRNPFNEMECGSNYARSMASFSLLLVYSGFLFDLPRGRLGFDPLRAPDERFRCLWSVDAAWGTVDITDNQLELNVEEGALSLLRLALPWLPAGRPAASVDGRPLPCRRDGDDVVLEGCRLSAGARLILTVEPSAETKG